MTRQRSGPAWEAVLAEIAATHTERLGSAGLRRLADELRPILAAPVGELERGRQVREVLAAWGIRVELQ